MTLFYILKKKKRSTFPVKEENNLDSPIEEETELITTIYHGAAFKNKIDCNFKMTNGVFFSDSQDNTEMTNELSRNEFFSPNNTAQTEGINDN